MGQLVEEKEGTQELPLRVGQRVLTKKRETLISRGGSVLIARVTTVRAEKRERRKKKIGEKQKVQ